MSYGCNCMIKAVLKKTCTYLIYLNLPINTVGGLKNELTFFIIKINVLNALHEWTSNGKDVLSIANRSDFPLQN